MAQIITRQQVQNCTSCFINTAWHHREQIPGADHAWLAIVMPTIR